MTSLGFVTMPTPPRGIRQGDIFAHKRNVIRASGGRDHRAIAVCATEAYARATAERLNQDLRQDAPGAREASGVPLDSGRAEKLWQTRAGERQRGLGL